MTAYTYSSQSDKQRVICQTSFIEPSLGIFNAPSTSMAKSYLPWVTRIPTTSFTLVSSRSKLGSNPLLDILTLITRVAETIGKSKSASFVTLF